MTSCDFGVELTSLRLWHISSQILEPPSKMTSDAYNPRLEVVITAYIDLKLTEKIMQF